MVSELYYKNVEGYYFGRETGLWDSQDLREVSSVRCASEVNPGVVNHQRSSR